MESTTAAVILGLILMLPLLIQLQMLVVRDQD